MNARAGVGLVMQEFVKPRKCSKCKFLGKEEFMPRPEVLEN
jgi:hypothetical protein